MNIEDDNYCTADYGVFGNNNCNCSLCQPPVPKPTSAYDKMISARLQARRENERKVSSNFNSYMIDLYNQARKL